MHTRHNLLLVALTSTLSFLPTLTTADLICQSPTSLLTNTLQPGTPLTLKFTNKPTLGSTLLSDVSAILICTSTGDSALTLATKLDSGKATSATLTPAQIASALKACPANSFHVQYQEGSLLSTTTGDCQGSFALQAATKESQNPGAGKDPAILVPPTISVPLPIPEVPTTTTSASATGSPSTVSTTPTATESHPTTTGASAPPTTTIPTITTSTGIPPITLPNPTSVTTPAAGTTTLKPHPAPTTTTTTTRPPKSGGGGGKGSGGNDVSTPPPSPTPTPTNDLASSDMQQSTGSGPSTATIAGISIGILAGVFVILGAMLIWRKRSQRKENFDLFYGGTLAAASGFPSGSDGTGTGAGASSSAEPPIYGRSAPEEEKYEMNGGAAPSRAVSSNAPRRSRSHTSNHNRSPMPASAPPPLMPMHPLPTAATGHDASYQQHQDSYYTNQQYHQHQLQHQPQHQNYYASQHQHQHQYQKPPQQKPSYSLPRHHPAFDNEYEHQFGQR